MTLMAAARLRARTGFAVATLALIPLTASCGDSPAQVLTKFCSAATDVEKAAAMSAKDDAAAVKNQMSAMADDLKSLAGKAPKEIKDDIKTVANAASDIANSLSESSSLTDTTKMMKSLNSKTIDAASKRINTFVTTNCKASS